MYSTKSNAIRQGVMEQCVKTLNGKLQKLLAKQSLVNHVKKTPLNTMNKGQGTFQVLCPFSFLIHLY